MLGPGWLSAELQSLCHDDQTKEEHALLFLHGHIFHMAIHDNCTRDGVMQSTYPILKKAARNWV